MSIERLDDRLLLSTSAIISPLLENPAGYQAVRPNTPVMPFATPAKKASFIDPTVAIDNGDSIVLGFQEFIGPFVTLDGTRGAIKIGNGSDVLDNASIVASSGRGYSGIRGSDRQLGRDWFWGKGYRAEHDRFLCGFKQTGLDRRQRRDRRGHYRARGDRLAAGSCRAGC